MNVGKAFWWSVVSSALLSTSVHAQDCPGCSADLNGDDIVDGVDLGMVLREWCTEGECDSPSDIDGDGFVDGSDLGQVLSQWGPCAPATSCPLRVVADTDRDGDIDNADLPGRAAWTIARGAFYLVNVDDDKRSAAKVSDAGEFDRTSSLVIIDNKINKGGDQVDITPFLVKPIRAMLAGDTVWLKTADIDQMKAIHVFAKVAQNKLVIGGGPTAAATEFEITPHVSKTENRTLGLEGLKYQLKDGAVLGMPAEMLFDGFVQLTVELRRAGAVVDADTVLLKVAPWVMTPNTLQAERLFVQNFSVPITAPSGAVVMTPNAKFREDLEGGLAPNTMVEFTTDGQWAQDEIEFGYSQTPRSLQRVAAYSRHHGSSDDQDIEGASVMGDAQWRRDFLLGAAPVARDIGHYRMPRPTGWDSGDYGGNIEMLPPTTNHPLGRICYGSRISDFKRQFFESQEVQPPFEVDTEWLAVGHVDEMISFWKGAPLTVILASPRLAYTELGFEGGVFPAPPPDATGGSSIPIPDHAVFFGEGDTTSGMVTGATPVSLQDASANFLSPPAQWSYVRIYEGTGAGQTAHIASIPNSSTLMIDAVWSGYDMSQPVLVETDQAAAPEGTMGFASLKSSSWLIVPDSTSKYVVVEDTMWWHQPPSVLAKGVFPDTTPALLTKKEFDPAGAIGKKIRDLNVEVQKRIDDARLAIKAAAAPDAVTFKEVPVLYNGRLDALGDIIDKSCVAFTPGAANAVIANGLVFVPAQKGPQWRNAGVMTKSFDDLIKTALGAGNVVWVEDWHHYHMLMGEVHCGTNVLRKPYAFKWWEKQPAGIPDLP